MSISDEFVEMSNAHGLFGFEQFFEPTLLMISVVCLVLSDGTG